MHAYYFWKKMRKRFVQSTPPAAGRQVQCMMRVVRNELVTRVQRLQKKCKKPQRHIVKTYVPLWLENVLDPNFPPRQVRRIQVLTLIRTWYIACLPQAGTWYFVQILS